jgi:hypothetical protein
MTPAPAPRPPYRSSKRPANPPRFRKIALAFRALGLRRNLDFLQSSLVIILRTRYNTVDDRNNKRAYVRSLEVHSGAGRPDPRRCCRDQSPFDVSGSTPWHRPYRYGSVIGSHGPARKPHGPRRRAPQSFRRLNPSLLKGAITWPAFTPPPPKRCHGFASADTAPHFLERSASMLAHPPNPERERGDAPMR